MSIWEKIWHWISVSLESWWWMCILCKCQSTLPLIHEQCGDMHYHLKSRIFTFSSTLQISSCFLDPASKATPVISPSWFSLTYSPFHTPVGQCDKWQKWWYVTFNIRLEKMWLASWVLTRFLSLSLSLSSYCCGKQLLWQGPHGERLKPLANSQTRNCGLPVTMEVSLVVNSPAMNVLK